MARATIQGVGAAPGVGRGRAFLYRRNPPTNGHGESPLLPLADRAREIERYREALKSAAGQLAALGAQVAERAGASEAAVFEAQAMFLDDPTLVEAAETAIRVDGRTARAAVGEVFEAAAQELAALDDEYLRARAADVRDVKARLASILGAPAAGTLTDAPPESVIIAEDLTPSDTAGLDPERVRGIILAGGTPTAHAAILARGLGLPLVVGAGATLWQIEHGQDILIDGSSGTVLVEPENDELPAAEHGSTERAAPLVSVVYGPAQTADGHRVELMANASTPAEARLAVRNGSEGIGLLRTEFMLPILQAGEAMPDEHELAEAYGAVLAPMGSRPVVVRALDAGGDKPLPFLDFEQEANPFLGWRGIRVLLDRQEVFAAQTRALLRAAARHRSDLRLMLPMVSTVEELRAARRIVEGALQETGVTLVSPLQLGVMIEVPAAALIADVLARDADFFSIGTNDLVQYTLACDRGNARVARLCRFEHPAVLRLIERTVRAAHARGKPVAVCGEAAGDPLGLPLLVGLGVDELSMGPARIPQARARLARLSYEQLQQVTEAAVKSSTADEVAGLFESPIVGE